MKAIIFISDMPKHIKLKYNNKYFIKIFENIKYKDCEFKIYMLKISIKLIKYKYNLNS